MKRWLIFGIFTLIIAAALVTAIDYHPGYLLISYGHYTLETSLWIAIAAILVLWLIVYVLYSVIRGLLLHSKRFGRWFSGRRYRRSQQQTLQGIIDFYEGNWQRAHEALISSASHSTIPFINYLLAACASSALGNTHQADALLQKTRKTMPKAELALIIVQAQCHLQQQQFEAARLALLLAYHQAPKNTHVLHLLQQTYVHLHDWLAIHDLLPALRKYAVLSAVKLTALEYQAASYCLQENATKRDTDALHAAWRQLPKSLTNHSELLTEYVGHLMALGDHKTAEHLIHKQLKHEWHPALVEAYGKLSDFNEHKLLARAESWLKQHADDADLLLCLGRLSLRNQLWGKAQEYFAQSIAVKPSVVAYAELSRLMAHWGKPEASQRYCEQGLSLSTTALLPDLPMPTHR